MDDILESPESDQPSQGNVINCKEPRTNKITFSDLNAHGQAGTGIMKDWVLVAAGIERFFFLIYAIAFALVSGVYM